MFAALLFGSSIVPPAGIVHEHAVKPVASVVVRSGDTLSDLAGAHHVSLARIERWNPQITDPNMITVGEIIAVALHGPHSPAEAHKAPSGTTDTVQSGPAASTGGSGSYSAPSSTPASTSGDSSFQACVIERESGGNPSAMNSSGHYGLYQFSSATWAAYGGNPADFGNASTAEQNQVFDSAMAAGGESNWAPYDGC